jgi:orotidine-5'-phosphate decarboxylase
MPDHFADRLFSAIGRKGSPVCVGIDPAYEKLPAELKAGGAGAPSLAEQVAAIEKFSLALVELVAPAVPAVKPQIAYFERYGSAGVAAYERVVKAARDAGLVVIGDVKRGDIGPTAQQYAIGHMLADDAPDAITLNGYFGVDGLQPFIDAGRSAGKGMFILVRTSNPSAKDIQDFSHCSGETFYMHLAGHVAAMGSGAGLVGESGYSLVGAVVGATYPDEARELRRVMPQQIFLVPGYGAQGATAKDCAAAFDNRGAGAIVNASRSVIYAFADKKRAGQPWKDAIAAAAKEFAQEIREAVAGKAG